MARRILKLLGEKDPQVSTHDCPCNETQFYRDQNTFGMSESTDLSLKMVGL